MGYYSPRSGPHTFWYFRWVFVVFVLLYLVLGKGVHNWEFLEGFSSGYFTFIQSSEWATHN